MVSTAYFDNAATTFPKPECVYTFADKTYREAGVNTGRGNYDLSNTAGSITLGCKSKLKTLLMCEGKNVVFTSSATDALNRILLGLDLSKDDYVYMSPFEHNAVSRTLWHLRSSKGIQIRQIPFNKSTLLLDENELRCRFEKEAPKLVVSIHGSNVCGAILPVERIAEISKEYGAITVIDMSQTAGLIPIQLSLETIDFAVFAGHKTLYAPFGIGGFICAMGESRLNPVFFGGNGINSIDQDMPREIISMEEIGSQNIYAISGLSASVEWLLDDSSQVAERERKNDERLRSILESYENIQLVGKSMECPHIGVVSCRFKGYSPGEIGTALSNLGIAVRTGLHCAPTAHEFLGTLPEGLVRFSISALTTDEDFCQLQRALAFIKDNG